MKAIQEQPFRQRGYRVYLFGERPENSGSGIPRGAGRQADPAEIKQLVQRKAINDAMRAAVTFRLRENQD